MEDWKGLKEKYEHKEKRHRKLWYVLPISAVVAVFLIVFFMTDYLRIGGLPQVGQASLEITDATCNFVRGEYYVSVKNVAEQGPVATDRIAVSLDDVIISSSMSWDKESIQAGDLGMATISGHNIESGSVHVVKIIGPDGRKGAANAIC